MSLVALLKEDGYDAKPIHKAADVWHAMDEVDPHAFLIDIGLPDRTGFELARELRKCFGDDRHLLIAVTAWDKEPDKVLARIAGFDHHVGKPYDPNYLLGLLAPLKTQARR
jgi:DNA-binding response OmpR family regulator